MLLSQQLAIERARRSPFYLGHNSVHQRTAWVTTPDGQLDVAVTAHEDGSRPNASDPPIIFSGVFGIMAGGFYATTDMAINPDHPADWQVGTFAHLFDTDIILLTLFDSVTWGLSMYLPKAVAVCSLGR
jgi:hypothetical protein